MVLAVARTFALHGVEAREVRVEVDVRAGIPAFTVVGLPDTAVRESRERVRAAVANSGFEFPMRRITVSLAPADLPKAGPGYDLAIAGGVLAASGQLPPELLDRVALAGELALDGAVRAIPGALAMAERARRAATERIAVPAANAQEAALANLSDVNGSGPAAPVGVLGLTTLGELSAVARGDGPSLQPPPRLPPADAVPVGLPDLADLRGQPFLRWALEVAAAGGHSLLMLGPPGAGKSMAGLRLQSLMPPLTAGEMIEAMRIASASGRPAAAPSRRRPFRAPHHTISAAGLVGGGSSPRAGEVTLAHRGVLFLDELGEFSRDALEALRQPLEEGRIVISRARGSVELPCRFILVAAANPCPCGRGAGEGDCECPPGAVRRYRSRLSGALADRIDIFLSVEQPPAAELGGPPGEPSEAVRARVVRARERQAERLGVGRCNGELGATELRRTASLEPGAGSALLAGHARLGLSARGRDRVVRVARTVADLDDSESVTCSHVGKALALRRRGG
jgi:magnesium chelatase family protein